MSKNRKPEDVLHVELPAGLKGQLVQKARVVGFSLKVAVTRAIETWLDEPAPAKPRKKKQEKS